jgi:regulatory protein
MTEFKSRKYSPEITRLKIFQWCDKAERCHKDVKEKLHSWIIPYTEREGLIVDLIQANLLNEARYASAFAHDKFNFNQWGIKKIEHQLKTKGVSARNIEDALRNIAQDEIAETVKKLILKKLSQLKGGTEANKKMKVLRYAASKGFDQDDIWAAINLIFKKR